MAMTDEETKSRRTKARIMAYKTLIRLNRFMPYVDQTAIVMSPQLNLGDEPNRTNIDFDTGDVWYTLTPSFRCYFMGNLFNGTLKLELGPGPGDGSGLGPGPGDGSGLGPGPGDGSGLGPGPGDGSGLGPGPGDGSGLGPGPGDGSGLGPGPGDGSGLGPGPGDAPGLGLGHGHGPRPGLGPIIMESNEDDQLMEMDEEPMMPPPTLRSRAPPRISLPPRLSPQGSIERRSPRLLREGTPPPRLSPQKTSPPGVFPEGHQLLKTEANNGILFPLVGPPKLDESDPGSESGSEDGSGSEFGHSPGHSPGPYYGGGQGHGGGGHGPSQAQQEYMRPLGLVPEGYEQAVAPAAPAGPPSDQDNYDGLRKWLQNERWPQNITASYTKKSKKIYGELLRLSNQINEMYEQFVTPKEVTNETYYQKRWRTMVNLLNGRYDSKLDKVVPTQKKLIVLPKQKLAARLIRYMVTGLPRNLLKQLNGLREELRKLCRNMIPVLSTQESDNADEEAERVEIRAVANKARARIQELIDDYSRAAALIVPVEWGMRVEVQEDGTVLIDGNVVGNLFGPDPIQWPDDLIEFEEPKRGKGKRKK